MNKELQGFARKRIKEGLALCTKPQREMFKRMYSPRDLEMPINAMIDAMPSDKLDRAMTQVKNTLDKQP